MPTGTKMMACPSYLRIENLKNPTQSRSPYLYSPYMGEMLPPLPCPLRILSSSCYVFFWNSSIISVHHRGLHASLQITALKSVKYLQEKVKRYITRALKTEIHFYHFNRSSKGFSLLAT